MANILFDSLGAQIQVQQETGNRLTTWKKSLMAAGHTLNFSDYKQPIGSQLGDNDVLVILTRQWTQAPDKAEGGCPKPATPPAANVIPKHWNFSYSSTDLGKITSWVGGGKGLLLFTNHTDATPYWPIYDISLAAAFGITTVYAAFGTTGMTMTPASGIPVTISKGVTSIQALDSGGILPGNGTTLIPLPSGCQDNGPFHYDPADCAFGALYPYQSGNVIVLGHSGITADDNTCWPSPGQISVADNNTFLNNCVAYLAG